LWEGQITLPADPDSYLLAGVPFQMNGTLYAAQQPALAYEPPLALPDASVGDSRIGTEQGSDPAHETENQQLRSENTQLRSEIHRLHEQQSAVQAAMRALQASVEALRAQNSEMARLQALQQTPQIPPPLSSASTSVLELGASDPVSELQVGDSAAATAAPPVVPAVTTIAPGSGAVMAALQTPQQIPPVLSHGSGDGTAPPAGDGSDSVLGGSDSAAAPVAALAASVMNEHAASSGNAVMMASSVLEPPPSSAQAVVNDPPGPPILSSFAASQRSSSPPAALTTSAPTTRTRDPSLTPQDNTEHSSQDTQRFSVRRMMAGAASYCSPQ
jgi:cell division protein FtsB